MQSAMTNPPARRRRVPTLPSESPTSQTSGTTGDVVDDDPAASEYESSTEDTETPAPAHTLLNEDPFSNETSKILFESIDELRRWGVGQDLELPQLVIVGKQSAGKSSLLQSLTDIPFPVGGGLCTRFATRIVSRRTGPGTADLVKASIEPNPGDINPFNYAPDLARLESFEQIIPSMTAEAFKTIIEKAKAVMGIDSSHGSRSQNFSSMVLKIELTGPKRSHFGILDVPGIFSATTRENIHKHEMEGVTQMVSSYMRRKENIIICVAEAGDIANEQILTLAKDLEVDSSRLVGVFTKCDKSQEPETIVDIVNDGEGIPGKILRWHVVRNPGPKAAADFDREQEEIAIFSKDPWLQIPPDQRGTPALRRHLAGLLCRRIREAFPGMKDRVETLLQQEKMRRKVLGESRSKKEQRRNFLIGIVKDFQDLSRKALRSPGDLLSDDMKLRGMTVKQNIQFATSLSKEGHFYKFLDIGDPVEIDYAPDVSATSEPLFRDLLNTRSAPAQGYPLSPAASPDRVVSESGRLRKQVVPIYQEIRSQMENNRGEELPGMLNPSVLRPLWKKQTSKWQTFGDQHLEAIVGSARTVSLKLFKEATANKKLTDRARCKLEAIITSFAEKERAMAKRKLEDVCTMNSMMAMQTTDKRFGQMVRQARLDRFSRGLGRFWAQHPTMGFVSLLPKAKDVKGPSDAELAALCKDWMVIHTTHVTQLFNEIHPQGERAQNVEDEIHDILRSYYEIEIENFTAHVVKHIVEPFLESPTGPLFGLSTDYIMNLTDEEVDDLGGEDEIIVASREACENKIARLEEAGRIAERAFRESRGMRDE